MDGTDVGLFMLYLIASLYFVWRLGIAVTQRKGGDACKLALPFRSLEGAIALILLGHSLYYAASVVARLLPAEYHTLAQEIVTLIETGIAILVPTFMLSLELYGMQNSKR